MNSVEPVIPTADDYAADVAATQASLRKAAERLGPKGDEARFYLLALSDTIGALFKTTKRWEMVTSEAIAGREAFGEGERARTMRDFITAAHESFAAEVRKRAERMIRTFDRRTTALIGGLIGGAFVGGLLIGALAVVIAFWGSGAGPWSANAAWAELARNNPDPGRALAQATDGAAPDGRRYKVLSLWTEPPKAPPTPSR